VRVDFLAVVNKGQVAVKVKFDPLVPPLFLTIEEAQWRLEQLLAAITEARAMRACIGKPAADARPCDTEPATTPKE